jgi:hypothetical protein
MMENEHTWTWTWSGETERLLGAIRVCDCGSVQFVKADHVLTPEAQAKMDEVVAKREAIRERQRERNRLAKAKRDAAKAGSQ